VVLASDTISNKIYNVHCKDDDETKANGD